MTQATSDAGTRVRLAVWVIGFSFGGIILASILAIALTSGTNRSEMVRLVFASVLPLFGTWIGTVLAFYFARENLQAATDSTIRTFRVAGGLEPGTPVAEVMIPRAQMHTYDLPNNETATNVSISELQARLTTSGFKRIPILKDSGAGLYVIHDSAIAQFAESAGKMVADLGHETLMDLLGDPDLKAQIEGIGYVDRNATVAESRTAMRSVKNCNDVFVTQGGQRDEPVIGWLTNTQLAGLE